MNKALRPLLLGWEQSRSCREEEAVGKQKRLQPLFLWKVCRDGAEMMCSGQTVPDVPAAIKCYWLIDWLIDWLIVLCRICPSLAVQQHIEVVPARSRQHLRRHTEWSASAWTAIAIFPARRNATGPRVCPRVGSTDRTFGCRKAVHDPRQRIRLGSFGSLSTGCRCWQQRLWSCESSLLTNWLVVGGSGFSARRALTVLQKSSFGVARHPVEKASC